jgi:uncharacterized membrane protein YgcG
MFARQHPTQGITSIPRQSLYGRSRLGKFLILVISILLLGLTPACALGITPKQDIPDPRLLSMRVLDLEAELSDLRKETLNQLLHDLYWQTGIDMYVVTAGDIYSPPEYGLMQPAELANQVFEQWQVGQGTGQGMVLVVSQLWDQVVLKMSASLTDVLPPAALEAYLFTTIMPEMSGHEYKQKLYSINLAMETLATALKGDSDFPWQAASGRNLHLPVAPEVKTLTSRAVRILVAED